MRPLFLKKAIIKKYEKIPLPFTLQVQITISLTKDRNNQIEECKEAHNKFFQMCKTKI